MAFVSTLLCLGRGAGAADGSLDGAADGSCVGVGVAELIGLAVGDGEGDGATTGTIGKLAPLEIFAEFVPPAIAAENAGLNARIAEITPAAIADDRIIEPPAQL